jgi:DNA-binding transcriptional LysR family regulator
VDLDAVRTFVAVADTGRFADAADDLDITPQAVSKRVAALENTLGVRLFTRTARGTQLTSDGQAFLPHARELLRAEERAIASVHPARRALRVDVIGRDLAPAVVLQEFHREHPNVALDVVTLFDAETAVAAVRDGTIDASFRAINRQPLPDGVHAARVYDESLYLLTGAAHPLATSHTVALTRLSGHRIRMPGNVPGTEWAAYYDDLAATFGLVIDPVGPNFGIDALLDAVAATGGATFIGDGMRLTAPAGHDLRRVTLCDPTPVYPHSLVWHVDNPHPALSALRDHLRAARLRQPAATTWTPAWA